MDHDPIPRWLLLVTAGWIGYCVARPDFFLSLLREDGGPFLIFAAIVVAFGCGWARERHQIARERRQAREVSRAAYRYYLERREAYRASRDG